MTDVNISPVTESEVMSFAERICTTIVAHSKQADFITELRANLGKSLDEANYLRQENSKLNTSIGESNTLADSYARERDAAQTELGSVKEKLQGLQDLLVSRDYAVSQLRLANDHLSIDNSSLSDKVKHLEFENGNLRGKLSDAERSRDNHAANVDMLHSELVSVRADLDAIQSIFNKPKPIPADQGKSEPEMLQPGMSAYLNHDHKAAAYTQATQVPITENGAGQSEPKKPDDEPTHRDDYNF